MGDSQFELIHGDWIETRHVSIHFTWSCKWKVKDSPVQSSNNSKVNSITNLVELSLRENCSKYGRLIEYHNRLDYIDKIAITNYYNTRINTTKKTGYYSYSKPNQNNRIEVVAELNRIDFVLAESLTSSGLALKRENTRIWRCIILKNVLGLTPPPRRGGLTKRQGRHRWALPG